MELYQFVVIYDVTYYIAEWNDNYMYVGTRYRSGLMDHYQRSDSSHLCICWRFLIFYLFLHQWFFFCIIEITTAHHFTRLQIQWFSCGWMTRKTRDMTTDTPCHCQCNPFYSPEPINPHPSSRPCWLYYTTRRQNSWFLCLLFSKWSLPWWDFNIKCSVDRRSFTAPSTDDNEDNFWSKHYCESTCLWTVSIFVHGCAAMDRSLNADQCALHKTDSWCIADTYPGEGMGYRRPFPTIWSGKHDRVFSMTDKGFGTVTGRFSSTCVTSWRIGLFPIVFWIHL